MPKNVIPPDIVDVKANIASGRLAVKINSLGNILLEDTKTCEAIKLMQLPDTFSFHEQGEWEPVFEYTSRSIDHPMEGHEAWACSVCGWVTDEKHDWCTCGADMRKYKVPSKQFKEFVDTL